MYDQIPCVPVRTVILDVDGRLDIYKGNDYFVVPLGSTTWPYSVTESGTCVRDISNGARFVILLEQLNYSLL